jgi:hypothetical protein
MTQPPFARPGDAYPAPDANPAPDAYAAPGSYSLPPAEAPASSAGAAWPAPGVAPIWAPPAGPVAAAGQRAPRRGVLVALAAGAGVVVGALAAGIITTTLFAAGAEDIGRGMGDELGPRIGSAAGEQFAQSVQGVFGSGITSEDVASGPVEQFPAIEPGSLGPDPVLNAYADSCFDGDMQACDDLYFESPPLSDYEQYAGTCGGRVKQFVVSACTDLG